MVEFAASTHLGPPWGAQLSTEDLAALDPGAAEGLLARPDVLVVGGGIVGLAAAAACARSGLGSVLVVEQGTLGSQTTGASAGLLLPEAHRRDRSPGFFELARASFSSWLSLQTEHPGGLGVTELDWVVLEGAFPELLADPPAGAEALSPEEVTALLPAIAMAVPALRLRQARVNPLLAVARLARSLPAPSRAATGVHVEAVRSSGGRVSSVKTSAGDLSPGVLVLATGGTPDIDGLGFSPPTRWVKGHLCLTEPTGLRWPGSVAPLATDIGGGRLLLGGTHDIGDRSAEVRSGVISQICAHFDSHVPGAASVGLSHAWCGFRPAYPDDLPAIGLVPGLDNAWLSTGHFSTGVLLAPASAAALAAWATEARVPDQVAEMRPDRLLA